MLELSNDVLQKMIGKTTGAKLKELRRIMQVRNMGNDVDFILNTLNKIDMLENEFMQNLLNVTTLMNDNQTALVNVYEVFYKSAWSKLAIERRLLRLGHRVVVCGIARKKYVRWLK